MRNLDFKSAVTFHPSRTGNALKNAEWALSPFLLGAGLAQVSGKKVEFFFQHHLENDVFAASVTHDGAEYASYHKSAKVVFNNLSIAINVWYERELTTYAANQKKKRSPGKKSSKGYRRTGSAGVGSSRVLQGGRKKRSKASR